MAKVISGFKCPYTKRIYHVGDEYDGEHLGEMQKKGYIATDELAPTPPLKPTPEHLELPQGANVKPLKDAKPKKNKG